MYKSYAVVLLLAFCLVGCGKKDHVIQDFSKWKMDGSSLASRLSEKQSPKVSFLQKWFSPVPEESGVKKRLEEMGLEVGSLELFEIRETPNGSEIVYQVYAMLKDDLYEVPVTEWSPADPNLLIFRDVLIFNEKLGPGACYHIPGAVTSGRSEDTMILAWKVKSDVPFGKVRYDSLPFPKGTLTKSMLDRIAADQGEIEADLAQHFSEIATKTEAYHAEQKQGIQDPSTVSSKFGGSGSGEPTKTAARGLGGAATGAAIGSLAGGGDGAGIGAAAGFLGGMIYDAVSKANDEKKAREAAQARKRALQAKLDQAKQAADRFFSAEVEMLKNKIRANRGRPPKPGQEVAQLAGQPTGLRRLSDMDFETQAEIKEQIAEIQARMDEVQRYLETAGYTVEGISLGYAGGAGGGLTVGKPSSSLMGSIFGWFGLGGGAAGSGHFTGKVSHSVRTENLIRAKSVQEGAIKQIEILLEMKEQLSVPTRAKLGGLLETQKKALQYINEGIEAQQRGTTFRWILLAVLLGGIVGGIVWLIRSLKRGFKAFGKGVVKVSENLAAGAKAGGSGSGVKATGGRGGAERQATNLSAWLSFGQSDQPVDAEDAQSHKLVTALSYVTFLFVVPLLAAPKSKFARFHANQGICLFGFQLALGLITPIFLKTFSVLPFMASLAGFVVSVLNIVPLLFMVLGILHVLQGRAVRLPLIGGFDILKD